MTDYIGLGVCGHNPTCPCGAPLDSPPEDDVTFLDPLDVLAGSGLRLCPACGINDAAPGDRYCADCGSASDRSSWIDGPEGFDG